jgi:hypothetical protein
VYHGSSKAANRGRPKQDQYGQGDESCAGQAPPLYRDSSLIGQAQPTDPMAVGSRTCPGLREGQALEKRPAAPEEEKLQASRRAVAL